MTDHRADIDAPITAAQREAAAGRGLEELLQLGQPMLDRETDEARITVAALRYAAGAWAYNANVALEALQGLHDELSEAIRDTATATLADAVNARRLADELGRRHDLTNATRSN